MTTPEEFLRQQSALQELAADELVVTMAKMYVFGVLPVPPATDPA